MPPSSSVFGQDQAQALFDQHTDPGHIYDAAYAGDPEFKKNIDYMKTLPDFASDGSPGYDDEFKKFAVSNQYFKNQNLPAVDPVTSNIRNMVAPPQPQDNGFSLGTAASSALDTAKGYARGLYADVAPTAAKMFQTGDELSSFLSGHGWNVSKVVNGKTEYMPASQITDTPEYQSFIKDLHATAYNEGIEPLMLLGSGGMSALPRAGLMGATTLGKGLLANAGMAPEGVDQGTLMGSLGQGVQSAFNSYLLFGSPTIGSAMRRNFINYTAQGILHNIISGNQQKQSIGDLLSRAAGNTATLGIFAKADEAARNAGLIQGFLNLGKQAPPSGDGGGDGGTPPAGPPPGGDETTVPGYQYKPMKTANMVQGVIQNASGLTPESQQVAGDPELRGMTNDFLQGRQTPQGVLDNFSSSFKNLGTQVSDLGPEYDFVDKSTQTIEPPTVKSADGSDVNEFNSILSKYKYQFSPEGEPTTSQIDGSTTQPGTLEGGPTAKPISSAQFTSLGKALQILNAPEITPGMLRAAKGLLTDVGSFYDPQLPGGGGVAKAIAGELLSKIDDVRSSDSSPSDFQQYAKLDEKYAPVRSQYEAAKDEFFTKDPVSGELRFKDSALPKVLNALNRNNYNLLDRLENIQPGITRQLRAYQTYQNIMEANKPGQYAKSAMKVAGAAAVLGGAGATAGGVPGAGIGGIVGGVLSLLASSPSVMFSVLSKYSDIAGSTGWDPAGIVMKAEHGAPLTPTETDAVRGAVSSVANQTANGETTAGTSNPAETSQPMSQPLPPEGQQGQASPPTVQQTSPQVNDNAPLSDTPQGQADIAASQTSDTTPLNQLDQQEYNRVQEAQAKGADELTYKLPYKRADAIASLKAGKTVDMPLDELTIDPKHLDLARESMKAGATGQDTGPVQVQVIGKKINLVNGYRRFLEARDAGTPTISVIHLPK